MEPAPDGPTSSARGNSVSSAEPLTEVHHTTILRLLVLAGEKCERLLGQKLKNVPVPDVQPENARPLNARRYTHIRRRKSAEVIADLTDALPVNPRLRQKQLESVRSQKGTRRWPRRQRGPPPVCEALRVAKAGATKLPQRYLGPTRYMAHCTTNPRGFGNTIKLTLEAKIRHWCEQCLSVMG